MGKEKGMKNFFFLLTFTQINLINYCSTIVYQLHPKLLDRIRDDTKQIPNYYDFVRTSVTKQ